jgi:CHAT domain-containing protein
LEAISSTQLWPNHRGKLKREYERSLSIFGRALSINEKVLGPEHPNVVSCLKNIGYSYLKTGDLLNCYTTVERWKISVETLLQEMLNLGEDQRLAWASHNLLFSLPAMILNPVEINQVILRWKGIVLDSLMEDKAMAKALNSTSEGKVAFAQIQLLKYQVAKLLTASGRIVPEKILNLQQQIDSLERSAAKNVHFGGRVRQSSKVTLDELRATLSSGETVLDFVSYHDIVGDSNYGVSLVSGGGDIKFIRNIGANEIDEALQESRRAIALGDETTLKNQYAILFQKLWQPIATALPPDTKRIYIGADGPLNFLSFATLQDDQGKFLTEKYQIAYVGSGRDLLRPAKPFDKKSIVIYANPVFGHEEVARPSLVSSNSAWTDRGMRPAELAKYSKVQLPQLPGTEEEATIVSQIAKESQWPSETHLGAHASKKGLMSMKSPTVLHLATHGFFLGGEVGGEVGERGMKLAAAPASPKEGAVNKPKPLKISPMRQSGVALAGGQSTLQAWGRGEFPDPSNDGILTAEEVAGLDLDGTWLVTLSACETGVGQVQSGEGVFGLRRAFMMAGAQNLLMTLWPVSDEVTPKIMADFYKKALATSDAAGSLSDVQRDWLVKLRKEKGLLAAVRDAGPFAMAVMANPNAKPTPSAKNDKNSLLNLTVASDPKTLTVSKPDHLIGAGVVEFQDILSMADAGDSYAQAVVALYYGLGYKTQKNVAKSAEYASKSAEQNNPLGLYQLGVLTCGGDGIEKDPEKGKQLKIQAVEGLNTMANDPYALAALGAMALRGEGVAKDFKKAAYLYRQSADLGYAPAQSIYAMMLVKGVGVPKDMDAARVYKVKSEDQNYYPQ